ncbi:carboxymuconolactone decarboxylase family protein [Actinoplanes sp. NPDC049668]|uniref:carboxymuconolactone decarboxylase family protein n=1 Tax=unclassified Actinoplanes TaxID=2626549 RepID=UPI0033BC2FC7
MPRLAIGNVAPGAYRAVYGMEKYCKDNVDPTLYKLIKLRASIVNGCSFCTDMHSREALEQGESSRRLFAVAAWHDAPFFTERERAALALTDSVTRLGEHGVPDEVWEPAAKEFTEEELGNLLVAIATINVWNRLSIATRTQPPTD